MTSAVAIPTSRLVVPAHAAILGIALLMRVASGPTAGLSYLLLAAYALFGRAHAIRALALSWLFTMLSPGLGPEVTGGSVARYAVLAGAAASVLLRSRIGRVRVETWGVLVLGAAITVHSILLSPFVDVSVLKALSWTVTMASLMAAWAGLAQEERAALSRQLFLGLAAVALCSVPLLLLPVGYLLNGVGFQGVLGHPQVFGTTAALLGAWAASQIFSQRRPSWALVGLLGLSLVLVVMSKARTAGVGLLFALAIATATMRWLSGRRLKVVLPGLLSTRTWLVAGLALAGVLAAGPMLSNQLGNYMTKYGEATNLLEAYDQTRGPLIDRMHANIRAQPLAGIGFGIASEPHLMNVDRDPLSGLPTGASVEKGVMPLAVLEELGVFGFGAVMFWFAWVLRRAARAGMAPFGVCLTALFLNLGESMFFSAGGMGLLVMITVAWAATAGKHHGGVR